MPRINHVPFSSPVLSFKISFKILKVVDAYAGDFFLAFPAQKNLCRFQEHQKTPQFLSVFRLPQNGKEPHVNIYRMWERLQFSSIYYCH